MTPGAETGPSEGEAWLTCALGHRHWGLFGAAGLLAHRDTVVGPEVLLQHRAGWSHHGDTWGLLGGARRPGEPAVTAALREAGEEAGVVPADVRVDSRYDDQHGGWSYSTIVATAATELAARALNRESIEVRWWPVAALPDIPLHPGFAATWPVLRPELVPLRLVVDSANVIGSRPDGWWRDRPGAAARLLRDLAELAARGLTTDELPPGLGLPVLRRRWPQVTAILEGAARGAVAAAAGPWRDVVVIEAAGSGDHAVVAALPASRSFPGRSLVVTADRELRRRCEALGAATVGPRWLLDLVSASGDQPRRP